MQSWSGEASHSERVRLLQAVAGKLGSKLPEEIGVIGTEEDIRDYDPNVSEALGLAFYYCARQIERVRRQKERAYGVVEDFDEIGRAFTAMLALLRSGKTEDDRKGVLYFLLDDFLNQLLLLSPDPKVLT